MAQLSARDGNRQSDGQAVNSSPDDVNQSQCSTNSSECSQIKYKKSRGFPATAKATNWTRSEMNRIFTNKGTKHNGFHSTALNGNDVSRGSHNSDDHHELLPLQDVTNSPSGSSNTTATTKPHVAQPRVYDLVAGKKSKKGKRQQPKKIVQNKKKSTSTSEITEAEHKELVVDEENSLTKNTLRLCHRKASGHSKNTGELVSEYSIS